MESYVAHSDAGQQRPLEWAAHVRGYDEALALRIGPTERLQACLADATDGDGSDLLFWLLLLLGGGAIVLAGVAVLRTHPWGAVAAFAIGGVAGSLALFWSVIAPLLAIVLLILGVIHARRATS